MNKTEIKHYTRLDGLNDPHVCNEWCNRICIEHDEPLPCGYCKTLAHFDSCEIYKKYGQCTCLLKELDHE